MSSSGTAHHTAGARSGRCVMAAPISSPPLLPPWTASTLAAVQPCGHQPVGGGVEVVEHVLLVAAPAGLVPGLAVLVAAAEPGDRVHAAGGAPGGEVRHPHRRLGDREAAVAGEDQRRVGGRDDVGAVRDEHRDLRAVERRVEHLADGQLGQQRRIGRACSTAARPSAAVKRCTADGRAERADTRRTPGPCASASSATTLAAPRSTDADRRRHRRAGSARRDRWPPGWRPRAVRRRTRRSAPTTTSGRSATTVVHTAGSSAAAHATTRPFGASRVVTPTSESPWTAQRRLRLDALARPRSTRPVTCPAGARRPATSRPSRGRARSGRRRDTLTSGHDSGVGSRSNTTGSSAGVVPRRWKRMWRWYSSPSG